MSLNVHFKRLLYLVSLGLSIGWTLAIRHDFHILPSGHIYLIGGLNLVMYGLLWLNHDLIAYGPRLATWGRLLGGLALGFLFIYLFEFFWLRYAVNYIDEFIFTHSF